MEYVCMVCIFVMLILGITEMIEPNKTIIAMLYIISMYILNKEE